VPFRFRRFALGALVIPHQAACFRRDFFFKLGGYDVDFGLAADQLFMLRAALSEPPVTLPDFLCDFDLSGAGSGRTPLKHFQDATRARRLVGIGSPVESMLSLGLAVDTYFRRRGALILARSVRS
jgi:hypothetical protein